MPTAAELRAYAERRARELGADPQEILAIGDRESSGFNPNIRDSPRGAIGVMQLMPDTARGLGVDPRDPFQNIEGGIRYYQQQRQRFGSPILAAAAYNAGPGAVRRHGGVPPFRETQDYVAGFPGPRVRRGRGGAAPAAQVANSDDIFGFSGNGGGQGQAAPAPAQAQNSDDIFGFAPERPARQRRPANVPPAPPPASGRSAGQGTTGNVRPMTPADRQQINPQALLTFTQTHDPGAVARIAPAPRRTRPGRNDPTGALFIRESNEALRRAGARPPTNPYVGAQANDAPRTYREAGAREARRNPVGAAVNTFNRAVPFADEVAAAMAVPFDMAAQRSLDVGQSWRNVRDQQAGMADELQRTNRPVSDLATGLGYAAQTGASLATGGGANAAAGGGALANIGRNAASGALYGGLNAYGSDGNLQERGEDALGGMALGGGLSAGLTGAGALLTRRAANAAVRPPTPQRVLANEGVSMLPGQMMGGAARRLEDGMTSIPVAGDVIRNAQRRGIDTFGRAAINRVLRPLGARLPNNVNAGRDGLAHAETTVSDAYNSALNPVTVRPDSRMGALIARARMGTTHPQMQQDLDAILADTIGARFRGNITGQEWKRLDEEIGAAIRAATAGMGTNPAQRQLRTALVQVQRGLRGAMQRQNPNAYARVRQADAATANLVRVRRASQTTGTAANGGQFTPAQLNNAVQATDNSAGNRDYARGDALLQDLTDPAMQVLPPSVPDSGTPIRSILSAAGLGGGAAATGVIPPSTVLGAGAAVTGIAAVYSPPVIWAINALYRAGGRVPPGQAEAALAVLAREAARNPALVPIYEQALGQARQSGAPRPTTPAQAEPTYQ